MWIDIHCHILPHLDDGPKHTEEAVEIARALQKLGFTAVCATPHVATGRWDNHPLVIREQVDTLGQRLAHENVDLEVLCGAEYLLEDSLFQRLLNRQVAHLGYGHVTLVEASASSQASGLADWLFRLEATGHRVLLAHPERYLSTGFAELVKIHHRGTPFQISLCNLGGKFGGRVKRAAIRLLREGCVDVLSTDTHHPGEVARFIEPGLEVVEKLLGTERMDTLLFRNPSRMVLAEAGEAEPKGEGSG